MEKRVNIWRILIFLETGIKDGVGESEKRVRVPKEDKSCEDQCGGKETQAAHTCEHLLVIYLLFFWGFYPLSTYLTILNSIGF